MPAQPTDLSLLIQLKSGDERQRNEALKQIFSRYRNEIYNWLKHKGLSMLDAQDRTMMTFEEVDTNRYKLYENIPLKAHIYRYAGYEYRDYWKERGKEIDTDSLEDNEGKPILIYNQDLTIPEPVSHIQKAIEALGQPCRTLLLLRAEGYTHEEMVKQTPWSYTPETLRNKCSDCRKELNKLLERADF